MGSANELSSARSIEIGDEFFDVDRLGFTHRTKDGGGDVFIHYDVPLCVTLIRKALIENGPHYLAPSLQVSRQRGLNQTFSDHVGFAHLGFPGGIEASILLMDEEFAQQFEAKP